MIETVIFLILIGLYIFSTIFAYKYIQISHSKIGVWKNIVPEFMDLFYTFLPIANCMLTVMYLLGDCYEDNDRHILNKFYNIHK